ncbi:MAG: hypothetical protein PHV93_04725 [Candidatus Pacebacteria bacterium]|nr:hypothetical protein [Candidatus Paceibacterota bacterium]
MASEAVIIELLGNGGDPIRYTVDNATAVAKGTIMKITDPRTAAATTAADEPVAGIAASEKVANDGSTTLALYTNGIFDLKDANAGGCTCGAMVAIGGANLIDDADANDLLQNSTVGYALETAAGAEVIAVRVKK